jgi:hypothetical protein
MDRGLRGRAAVLAQQDRRYAVGGADLDAVRAAGGHCGQRRQAVRERRRPLRQQQQRQCTQQQGPEARHRGRG